MWASENLWSLHAQHVRVRSHVNLHLTKRKFGIDFTVQEVRFCQKPCTYPLFWVVHISKTKVVFFYKVQSLANGVKDYLPFRIFLQVLKHVTSESSENDQTKHKTQVYSQVEICKRKEMNRWKALWELTAMQSFTCKHAYKAAGIKTQYQKTICRNKAAR